MKLPALPTGADLLFSVKCFVASMLALYVSLAAGLPRPFWAMMTAYIVASPFSGAVRSKALFRVCGTLVGSIVTIIMVPRMANAPELLSLALACWVGLCLYISLLDRTPRSYVFMLAGYTAGLIGFPAVNDPASVFDSGLARVEEISIGILSATVVHSLLFPQGIGPVLLARLDRAIGDAQRWMVEALRPAGGKPAPAGVPARLALAGEISEMRLMSTHLPFDTSQLRWTASMVHGLQDRLTAMVPLLLAVEDRLNALRQTDPASLAPWQQVLEQIAAWVQAGQAADPGRAAELRAALAQLRPALRPHASWSELLRLNLAHRLDALVEACEDGLELRSNVSAVMAGAAATYRTPHVTPAALHRDHGMALRSALAAVLCILLCCTFWIATAWSSGAAAPMMAGVLCCFFATQDDPVPAIASFTKWTIISMPLGALYILCVLPAIHSYEMLVLVMAPVFLIGGMYMPRPATMGSSLAFLIGLAGTLSLQDTGTLNIPGFLNSMAAQLFGFIAAASTTRMLRTVGGDWMARRMLRTARREVAQAARTSSPQSLLHISARMVDRIGLLMPRLALAHPAPAERAAAVEALRELRVGLHIAQLSGLQATLAQRGVSLQPLMQQLGSYFGSGAEGQAPPDLLEQLDRTLRAVCAVAADVNHASAQPQAAAALASMRRDLFPRAAAYQPEIAP